MNLRTATILWKLAAVSLAIAAMTCTSYGLNPPQYAFSINLTQVPQPFSPISLGVDSSGNLYAGCSGDVVAKLSANGSYITQWGVTSPSYLAVDNAINYIFVIDSEDYTVDQFFPDGTFYQEWGGVGSLPGQFNGPSGIAITSDGTIFVADAFNQRIQVFDSNVSYNSEWGVLGDGPGQIDGPAGVAVDSSNNVYVIDVPTNAVNNFRIQRFTTNGTYLNQWFTPPETTAYVGIAGITTDNSNRVYVVDASNNDVLIYDTNGTLLTKFGSTGSAPGQFTSPGGIAIDPTGNYVYVADYYNARIDVFAYAPASPIIYSQPTNQIVPGGATVTLSAAAYGASTLVYQWMSNGVPITGATNTTLTISNIDPASSGDAYSIVVTNPLGTSVSGSAMITVVPALVTTLPASGISATGAALNGTTTTGSSATTAWFEWGTDTTYGNVTGPDNLPLNSTVSLSNALSGLSGLNLYHYRIDASNALGVVTGSDQTFAVGLKPTVATLPTSNATTTSITVNATANPEGLDTIAYFRWGTSASYGHNTAGVGLGSGASPQTINAGISGLAAGVIYHFQAVASNSLGVVSSADATFIAGPWTYAVPTTIPVVALAVSADGNNLAAASSQYALYYSRDGGTSWTSTNQPEGQWLGICSSANGSNIALVCGLGGYRIFLSTNTGASWTNVSGLSRNWYGIASSGDGTRLAAVADSPGAIYTTTNGGASWVSNNVPTTYQWSAIASSADGLKLVAAAGGSQPGAGSGPIYTSTNGGLAWSSNNVPHYYWQAVASSADGTKLAAAAGGYYTNGPIYLSSNSGLTWNPSTAPVTNWQAIASSADGSRLAAIPRTGNLLYSSVDSGSNWTTSILPNSTWYSLALSADGGKVAVGGQQGIFTLQNVVAPALASSVSGGNVAVSWIVPSVPFQLQQTANLSRNNWAAVTNPPTLVPNDLLYQVVLPLGTPAGFYRLKQP